MAVAFQTYTTAGADFAGGTGNVSVSPPSGLTTDDLWLISSGCDTNGHPTNVVQTASGFVAVSDGVQTGAGNWPQLRSQWKKAGASESAVNVPFGVSPPSPTWEAQCFSMRFDGQDLTTPIGNTSVGGNSAGGTTPQTVTLGAISIGAAGSMVLEHIGFDHQSGASPAIAPSSGYTEIAEFTPTSNNCKTGVAYKAVNAGTETPGSISCSITSGVIAQLYSQVIEIKPAATAGSRNYGPDGQRMNPLLRM